MSSGLKKTLLTGLGLISLSKKKLEETAKEIAQKHGISQKEAEKLAIDLVQRAEEKRDDLEEDYEKAYSKALKKMNLPTREEFEILEQRVEELEEKIKKDSLGEEKNS
jgi:polyhydroxyalkanoate synthesis regulator phasin